ncbi:MAG: T9SS type A sorting domain-containing protein [Aquaticitalea sp.]
MKTTTRGDLSRKLLKYGALSAAVMGIADASGQIVYTDIADITLTPGGTTFVDLDINANGVNDYRVSNTTSQALLFPLNTAGNVVQGGPNGFRGHIVPPEYAYPSNLIANVTVNSTNNVIGLQGFLASNNCVIASAWCGGVTDGYAGLVLDIGGTTHYGWLRMDLAADRSSLVIKDFAYNTVADATIFTGQGALGISENIFNGFKHFVDASKNLNLLSSTPIDELRIYDLLGKEVKQMRLNSTRSSVSVSDFNAGIYFAKAIAEGETKTFKFLVK